MTLGRSTLAKIDTRIRSQLDHEEGTQLVKVPVSDAMWSTWRRYCDLAQVSMGRGLALLLAQELASVADIDLDGLSRSITERESAVAGREAEMADREAEVDRRQAELEVQERKRAYEASQRTKTSHAPPAPVRHGRNQPCWCGSDKKFKYCHGRSS